MINLNFFSQLLRTYSRYNSQRHEVIKWSNDALRLSKQAIFSVHRQDLTQAEKFLAEAEKIFKQLGGMFAVDADLKTEGAYIAAIEEYVEAKFFWRYFTGKKIDDIKADFPIGYDEYLSGLCDFTGELARQAVILATQNKTTAVDEIKTTVEAIIGELIKFDMVGKLRVKYDEAKRNLKRLEEIVYDLKLRA